MKNPIKSLKGLKMTPKLIVGISVVGVSLVTLTTVGVTQYNNISRVADTQELADKETKRLTGIIEIENETSATNPDGQSNTAPGQSSSGTSGDGTSSSPTRPGQAPTSNPSAPSSGNDPPASTPPYNTSPPDNDTPQVTLTYPSMWKQTVSGIITITATASDATSGIQKVILSVHKIGDATPVYSFADTTAPYSTTFDTRTLPNGSDHYTVVAQAFDNAGKGNSASLRINIQN